MKNKYSAPVAVISEGIELELKCPFCEKRNAGVRFSIKPKNGLLFFEFVSCLECKNEKSMTFNFFLAKQILDKL